jgi:hypothetical protein
MTNAGEDLAGRQWQLCTVPKECAHTLILGDVPGVGWNLPRSAVEGWARVIVVPLDPWTLLAIRPWRAPDLKPHLMRSIDVVITNRKSWSEATRHAIAHGDAMLYDKLLDGQVFCPPFLQSFEPSDRGDAYDEFWRRRG